MCRVHKLVPGPVGYFSPDQKVPEVLRPSVPTHQFALEEEIGVGAPSQHGPVFEHKFSQRVVSGVIGGD